MPPIEDVMMMAPLPRFLIAGIAYFNPRNTPRTFTAITWSNASTG